MNLTKDTARLYDLGRRLLFTSEVSLKLLSYEQSTGEVELLTVERGWMPKPSTDSETSSVQVWITERDEITKTLMNDVARFTIEDTTFRVIPGGITPPLWQPRQWQLQGEEIRENV